MTVKCPKCGKNNLDEAYICQFCDSPLVIYQPHEIPAPDIVKPDQVKHIPDSTPADEEAPKSENIEEGSAEWLQKLRQKKEEDAQKLGEDFFNRFGPAVPPEGETTDKMEGEEWLRKLRQSETLPPSLPFDEDIEGQAEAEVPEWLSTIRNKITVDVPKEEVKPPADSGEDWLNKLRRQTEELHEPATGLPGWAQTTPGDSTDEFTQKPIAFIPEEESPAPVVELPVEEPPIEGIPEEEPRQPVLFDDLQPPAEYPIEMPFTEEQAEEPEHPIPEALRNSIPQIDASQLSEDILPPEEELLKMRDEPREKISSREIPNWLTNILGENEAEATAMSAVGASSSEGAEGEPVQPGPLPGWVQAMRPTEITSPMKASASETDKAVETEGPLAGIRGILPGEGVIPTYSRAVDYHVGVENRQKREDHVQAFQDILKAEQVEVKVPGYRRTRAAGTVRWIMMVLLFFVMLAAIVGGSKPENLPASMPRETIQLFQSIVALQPGAKILIAMDYEPAYAGEVEAVASPVLNHLMVKQTDLYVISTNPTGIALAQKMLDNIGLYPQTSHAPYLAKEKFHLVGYLPGGQAGIQALNTGISKAVPLTQDLTNTTELPGITGVPDLSQFSALLILSDQPDTVRSWLEQINQKEGVPALWAVVSAQAVPMLRPYVRSGQLKGLAAGEYGGALYERIFQQPGIAWGQWNAYQTGLITALILVLVGGLLNFTGQLILQARRKKTA
jgi:hypothetical protein